jgi:hypothetical protein
LTEEAFRTQSVLAGTGRARTRLATWCGGSPMKPGVLGWDDLQVYLAGRPGSRPKVAVLTSAGAAAVSLGLRVCRRVVVGATGVKAGVVDDIEVLLAAVGAWGRRRNDVHVALLVGSQARAEVPADQRSDVDVVLMVDEPVRYAGEAGWLGLLSVACRRTLVMAARRLADA